MWLSHWYFFEGFHIFLVSDYFQRTHKNVEGPKQTNIGWIILIMVITQQVYIKVWLQRSVQVFSEKDRTTFSSLHNIVTAYNDVIPETIKKVLLKNTTPKSTIHGGILIQLNKTWIRKPANKTQNTLRFFWKIRLFTEHQFFHGNKIQGRNSSWLRTFPVLLEQFLFFLDNTNLAFIYVWVNETFKRSQVRVYHDLNSSLAKYWHCRQ